MRDERKDFDSMFDYRYSRLPLFFAWVIRQNYFAETAPAGLSDDKRAKVRCLLESKWERP